MHASQVPALLKAATDTCRRSGHAIVACLLGNVMGCKLEVAPGGFATGHDAVVKLAR